MRLMTAFRRLFYAAAQAGVRVVPAMPRMPRVAAVSL
jgi:hypothetical protein